MIETYTYHIAGLSLEIVFPEGFKHEELLPSFEPFLVRHGAEQEVDCSIELVDGSSTEYLKEEKLLSNVSDVWGKHFRFYEQENGYSTAIKSEESQGLWMMKSNKDFSHSVIYMLDEESSISSVISWLIMMAFGQACLLHKVILIHASAIICDTKGHAFLGKSGTGKSTHSRLWLDHIEGTELLNDDNPAIKLEEDGKVYIYGSPWSGKTACYKNDKVQVQSIIRIKQAACNQLSMKKGAAAFICVLPSCTAIRWNKRLFGEMNNTLEAIVQKVIVAELECLPNKDAALLCYHETLNTNTK